jgi:hypothetical protein
MMLFGYLADVQNLSLETNMNYSGLFIAMIAQEADPWNIYYTVVPIILWVVIYVVIKIR